MKRASSFAVDLEEHTAPEAIQAEASKRHGPEIFCRNFRTAPQDGVEFITNNPGVGITSGSGLDRIIGISETGASAKNDSNPLASILVR